MVNVVRMWMCQPEILCRKHLLGEHNELHKLAGSLVKKRSITGYVKNECVEPTSMDERHQELVDEMVTRGYKHQSPFEMPDISYLPLDEQLATVPMSKSLALLLTRCPECHERFRTLMKGGFK